MLIFLCGFINIPAFGAAFRTAFVRATVGVRTMTTQSHRVLGVKENASREEIQAAFARLAKKLHPDQGGKKEDFIELLAAYKELMKNTSESNEQSRQEYKRQQEREEELKRQKEQWERERREQKEKERREHQEQQQ